MEGEGVKIVLALLFLMATGRVILHVIFLGTSSFAPENFAQEDLRSSSICPQLLHAW